MTKLTEPSRGVGKVGLEDPFEPKERFFMKDYKIERSAIYPSFLEAVTDRFGRESRIVLDAGEPLFLGGCDNLTVPNETRCAVVIKG